MNSDRIYKNEDVKLDINIKRYIINIKGSFKCV